METAAIHHVKLASGPMSGTKWQFQFVDANGTVLLKSEPFPGPNGLPMRHKKSEAEMDHLYAQIRRQGWQVTNPPINEAYWWAFNFARGDGLVVTYAPQPQAGAAPAKQPQQVYQYQTERKGPGCGIWTMWGLTIAVVIGLFLICVVLAFTTEIRFTATGS